MLGMANFQSSLFWAVLIGWILSVVLHEFAHGITAYWGGDYTIRERGGLTLNPLQYVDPIYSIVMPVIFLLAGGIPLPGGSTFVRRDLLRGRGWDTAVSLAGPATNLLLFLICMVSLKFGPASYVPGADTTQLQDFLGATAVLQLLAVIFNLIPVPPLDGFQAISPWMPDDLRRKLSTPPWSTGLFLGFFVIIWKLDIVNHLFKYVIPPILSLMKFDDETLFFLWNSFNKLFRPG